MSDKVHVTPRAHRAKWARAETVYDSPSIDELIDRSSIGAGLRNIRENGLDAELADLERDMRPRRFRP